jgi:hypothetical protein
MFHEDTLYAPESRLGFLDSVKSGCTWGRSGGGGSTVEASLGQMAPKP